MPTKQLTFQPDSTRTVASTEEHIEVPAGRHHFVIKQTEEVQSHAFHLRHPESEIVIIGLVNAAKNDKFNLETAVIHHAPHTKAETRIKTLSQDKAEPRFRGMIRIEPNSHNCESYLTHSSLLLGTTAQSWTTPSLEILNNEVKCSHAATVRTITDLDLFYLQSRGLSKKTSQNLLIDAFLSDVQS